MSLACRSSAASAVLREMQRAPWRWWWKRLDGCSLDDLLLCAALQQERFDSEPLYGFIHAPAGRGMPGRGQVMEKTCRLKAWPMAAVATCVLQCGLGAGARGCMAISRYQAALMLHLRHIGNLQFSGMGCNGDNSAKGEPGELSQALHDTQATEERHRARALPATDEEAGRMKLTGRQSCALHPKAAMPRPPCQLSSSPDSTTICAVLHCYSERAPLFSCHDRQRSPGAQG